jgi:phosphatidylethanolamine/phosphatidyl-N-methylethanolamine N-methyltransferase
MTDHKPSSVYDKLADQYDILFGIILGPGHKVAIHTMDLKPGMSVLEVGVGTGLSLPHFPESVSVIGIDLAASMLEKAEARIRGLNRKNIELKLMSAEDLEFPDNHFDRVFAPSILSVVNHPEKALNEMIRTCKPGGIACIISHVAGDTVYSKMLDRLFEPITKRFLAFHMNMPSGFIENHPDATVILKRDLLPLNGNKLYLLQKKD